jgi:hypothetical protein
MRTFETGSTGRTGNLPKVWRNRCYGHAISTINIVADHRFVIGAVVSSWWPRTVVVDARRRRKCGHVIVVAPYNRHRQSHRRGCQQEVIVVKVAVAL